VGSPRGYAASAEASAGFAACRVYTNCKNRRVRLFPRNMKLLITAAHRQEEADAFSLPFRFKICGFLTGDGGR
ncbi:hypothetical protein, partial [Butyricicoccus sp.]|uniref:hypothetical protein n=1 Tax=Butyricicoccus sp. TaxID=2049021 RepID=UPI0037368323